jgi:Collagen triple helix repeat (20 copies)
LLYESCSRNALTINSSRYNEPDLSSRAFHGLMLFTGASGLTGQSGATGVTGSTGFTGPAGFQGQTGSTGDKGSNGFTGASGSTGLDGATGQQGQRGATGSKGDTGSSGLPGENINTFMKQMHIVEIQFAYTIMDYIDMHSPMCTSVLKGLYFSLSLKPHYSIQKRRADRHRKQRCPYVE